MAKLTPEQLEGALEVLSVGFIKSAAVKVIQAHINELDGDIKIRDKAISEMQQQIDQAREDERRAVAAADRLKDNVIQLNREKRELEEKLEAADKLVSFDSREATKVALPREVAEAIEYLGHRHSRKNILELVFNGQIRGRKLDYDDVRNKAVSTLRDYEYEDILLALVNGYTVEELTAEDRMEAKLEQFLFVHNVQSPIAPKELAKKLVLVAREAIRETSEISSVEE